MEKLRDMLKETYKLDYAQCQDSAAHKLFFLSTDLLNAWGIRYNIVKQEKGELFLILPLAFHQSFNVGYNVVEAINFFICGNYDLRHKLPNPKNPILV